MTKSKAPTRLIVFLTAIMIFSVISVSAANGDTLIAAGTPLGVRFRTEGVMITGIRPVNDSEASPALDAGLRRGDVIVFINDRKIQSADTLLDTVKNSEGKVTVKYLRAGKEMTEAEILQIVAEEDFDVTLSGGDPMYHPAEVRQLAIKIHELGHSVWLYTGFTWEELIKNADLAHVLPEIDVIVDGPFIEKYRDPDLLFRGSANQRIIDVAKSLEAGIPVDWIR